MVDLGCNPNLYCHWKIVLSMNAILILIRQNKLWTIRFTWEHFFFSNSMGKNSQIKAESQFIEKVFSC